MREAVERIRPGTLDPALKLDLETGIRACLETFYKVNGEDWSRTEQAIESTFKTDVSVLVVITWMCVIAMGI